MKTIKLLSAAALLVAASSSAFASGEDGKSDNAWLVQTPIAQSVAVRQAPAPTASAAARQAINTDAGSQSSTLFDAVQP